MTEPEVQEGVDTTAFENNLEDMLDQAIDEPEPIGDDANETDQLDDTATRWALPVMKADPNNIIHYEEETNQHKRRKSDQVEQKELSALDRLKLAYTAQWREELTKEIHQELKDVAHDEGFQEGFQKGLDQSIIETRNLQQQLRSLIECIEKPLDAINEEVEEQIELLAVTLAQQLVRREIKSNPGEIIGVIRESIKLLPASSRKIKVTIHPEDAIVVKEALSINENDDDLKCVFLEDPLLTRGGCIIKSEQSVINVTLENRLASLAGSVLSGSRSIDDANESIETVASKETKEPKHIQDDVESSDVVENTPLESAQNSENELSSVEEQTKPPLSDELNEDKDA